MAFRRSFFFFFFPSGSAGGSSSTFRSYCEKGSMTFPLFSNSNLSYFRQLVCLKMWFSYSYHLSPVFPPKKQKKNLLALFTKGTKYGFFFWFIFCIQLILLSLYLSATCNLLVATSGRRRYRCKYWYIMLFSPPVNSAPTILNCWYDSNGIFLYICVRCICLPRPWPSWHVLLVMFKLYLWEKKGKKGEKKRGFCSLAAMLAYSHQAFEH